MTRVPAATRLELLGELYGDAGPSVAERIDRVLDGVPRPLRPPAPPPAAEDAWLVTYADQFRSPGDAPLQTLRDFHRRWLASEVTGIHVLPFHPWSSDDGFSVIDYATVEPAYGTWENLEALAEDARLMVDAVLNHTSVASPWFRGFASGDPEYAGFYRTADPAADLSAVVRARSHPLLTPFETAAGRAWVWTTFSADQADLDYRNPEVLIGMVEALVRYVRHGARVIRLDAVAFIGKEEGSVCLHLPQTYRIVELLRACLDEVDPGIVLITETNVPHDENVSYFGDGSRRRAQLVYQFALPPLVLHSFLTGDAAALTSWARSLDLAVAGTTFANFLASHDGIGLRPAEGILTAEESSRLAGASIDAGGRVRDRALPDGTTAVYEVNSTWFDLMAVGHDADEAVARHLAAHAIILALQGVPLLYVHSLFGTSNDQAGYQSTGHPRTLNRHKFDPVSEIEAPLADPNSRASRILAGMKQLLRWRADRPAFDPFSGQTVHDAGPGVFMVERLSPAGGRALVAVNVTGEPQEVALPTGSWREMGSPAAPGPDALLPPWTSLWLDDAALEGSL